MPEEIRFVDKPDKGFPAPPGVQITRAVPVGVAGISITDVGERPTNETLAALRHGMRIKQVLARRSGLIDPKQREDDDQMDSGK